MTIKDMNFPLKNDNEILHAPNLSCFILYFVYCVIYKNSIVFDLNFIRQDII